MEIGWSKVTLGRTGLKVSRLGLGASFGVGTSNVERAFERGINYLYWGSARRSDFGRAIRHIARHSRENLVVVVQSYSRSRLALGPSVEIALRQLGIEYADVLLLGWWNQPPPERIMDTAMTLRESGKVHHLMVSCHHRPTFRAYIQDPCYGAVMVRYNAAHPGAERDVFPVLDEHQTHHELPGVVAYTATRWGHLLDHAMVPEGEIVPRASDCYRFVLSDPHVHVSLVGARNGAELDEAMAALDRGPMDPDELAWMRRVGYGVRQAARGATGTPLQRFARRARSLLMSQD